MDLQPARQFDYLQRTLSIFLTRASNMSEQFESLIEELIKENKLSNQSPKNSPESSSSDSKLDAQSANNSPQPLPKKRSAPIAGNSKPPPSKRLKSTTPIKDEDDEIVPINSKKKKATSEEKLTPDDDDEEETNDDDEEIKAKPSESRDMDEFAIQLGLVCNKCMVLTVEKDNRLVECHECHIMYHQKCHRPPVSTADISDPRCLWYCSKCRRAVTKRQTQPSIKETKLNSNPSSSTNKSKASESTFSSAKKGLSTSITDVTTGLFSFKAKSSDSIASDSNTLSHPSVSSSTSSTANGVTTPSSTTKNANGWASLATGFKEKKASSEVTSTSNPSASSILTELTSLTAKTNNNTTTANETKTTSAEPLTPLSTKPLLNGSGIGLLKASSASLSSIKPTKPSSPPVLKHQLSASSLKPPTKVLPIAKTLQRISSPTPLGRPTSLVKSPPATSNPAYQRLNSSGSNSSGSNSPSSINTKGTKIATALDYDKRLKQIKKMAAEKSFPKKS